MGHRDQSCFCIRMRTHAKRKYAASDHARRERFASERLRFIVSLDSFCYIHTKYARIKPTLCFLPEYLAVSLEKSLEKKNRTEKTPGLGEKEYG